MTGCFPGFSPGEPVEMQSRLRRVYVALLAPAVALFAALYVVRKLELVDTGAIRAAHPMLGMGIFFLAAVFGVAAPLLLRTFFVYKHRTAQYIEEKELERFEGQLLQVSLVTPYLAVLAAFFEIRTVYFAMTVLAAFYALYYFYPSEKRVSYEKKIFRVR